MSQGADQPHPVDVNVNKVNDVDKVNDIDDLFPELERKDSKGDGLAGSLAGMDIGGHRGHLEEYEAQEDDDNEESSPTSSEGEIYMPTPSKMAYQAYKETEEYKNAMVEAQIHEKADTLSELLKTPFIPLVRPLTAADLDSCIALENEAFKDPDHRATPGKIEYRLSRCPELCFGLFLTIDPNNAAANEVASGIASYQTSGLIETGRPDKHVLLAHIISTRTKERTITDDAMKYPLDWKTDKGAEARTGLGHQPLGNTIALHSLAVAELVQGHGLGTLIMKHYIQMIRYLDHADRLVLLAQEDKINYYRKFNMRAMGASETKSVGEGWTNMKLDVPSQEPPKPDKGKGKGKEKEEK